MSAYRYFLAVGSICNNLGDMPSFRHFHEVVVCRIKENHAIMCDKEVIEFSFGCLDPIEASESLQVRHPHIGDESTGRLHILHEFRDVSRMACSHLHHSDVVAVVKGQQCLWNTYIIVEVTLREHHIVFLRKDGCNQLLCRCLAICTSNTNDRNGKLPSVFP